MGKVEQNLLAFRVKLLRYMPFYGDIFFKLTFEADTSIPTACTDGSKVLYNPNFMGILPPSKQNFIWMHEVLHVVLLHAYRCGRRDPRLWNVAIDLIVNQILVNMTKEMQAAGIPFEKEEHGLYAAIYSSQTAEDLYQKLKEDNSRAKKDKLILRDSYKPFGPSKKTTIDYPHRRQDVIFQAVELVDGEPIPLKDGRGNTMPISQKQIESIHNIQDMLQEALSKGNQGCSPFGHFQIPVEILKLGRKPALNWKTLLRNHLMEIESEETSYMTPERKYLHMDLIIPGYGQKEETMGEVWAFVDCSGSIDQQQLSSFLTELYHLTKEFSCTLNLCYWDTAVGDVHRRIRDPKKLEHLMPTHSGGTNINCVYKWLRDEKVKPEVMLILTDGAFGKLDEQVFLPKLRPDTILVLSGNYPNPDYARIGKIARL